MSTNHRSESGAVPSAAPNLSLRESNRQRAMRHIQETALDLFDANGFDHVTVEQVAAASGVSPSTVYRYFGTKDRLVLHDEEDRLMASVLLAALQQGQGFVPAARTVLEALRPFLQQQSTYLRRRFRYVVSEQAVRSAMIQEAQDGIDHVAAEICAMRGREPGDLDITLSVTLLVNALLVAVQVWARRDFTDDVADIVLQCLDILERGLTI